MFKSPIDYVKEFFIDLISNYSQLAFGALEKFMFTPEAFDDEVWKSAYLIIFTLAITWGGILFSFHMFRKLVSMFSGQESRSTQEIASKTVIGSIMAVCAPFFVTQVLIKSNNLIVGIFLDKGVKLDNLKQFGEVKAESTISVCIAGLVLTVLFLVLAVQYIVRNAQLLVAVLVSPLAAMSLISDNEFFSIWWRETVTIVYTHAFQVVILYLVVNKITTGTELMDFVTAIGYMVVLLTGPTVLRKFVYSTGTGRMVTSAAGSAGKLAMYKFAARRALG